MSEVVEATPIETQTPSEFLGETGGPSCSTGSMRWMGWLGLALVVAGMRRRGAVVAALLAASALGTGVAHAQDSSATNRFARDTTPAWTNFEFQVGSFDYAQPELDRLYGARATMVNLQAGLQIFRVLELDAGVGLIQKKGNTINPDTEALSSEDVRMQWLPLSIGATGRLHFIDEQPLVPYGLIAYDFVFWRETPLEEAGTPRANERVIGSKTMWHWGVGGNILLDLFSPKRASQLEATTGINDTWLTVEYRRYVTGQVTGLDMAGWSISAGIKLDY